jgi:nicotinamidase-related amidase
LSLNSIFFLDIDTQKDFLYSDGSCYMQNGERILPVLQRLTQFALGKALPLISTACVHEPNTKNFHNLPAHCLLGHDGAAKVPESLHLRHHRIENHHVDRNMTHLLQNYTQIVVEKSEDGLLGNPNSPRMLSCLGKNSFVYGCNEKSVEMAITELLQRGIQVVVVEDACAWRDPAKGRRVLAEMEKRGVRRIASKQLFTTLAE